MDEQVSQDAGGARWMPSKSQGRIQLSTGTHANYSVFDKHSSDRDGDSCLSLG